MTNLGLPLISAVVPIAVGALFRLFQYLIERATPRRPGESRLPSYVGAAGLLSGAFAGLILAVGLLGHMTTERDDYGAWLAILCSSAAGGVWMVVAAGNWRMWQSDAGIQIRGGLGVTKPFTAWTSIARVRTTKLTSEMVFQIREGGELKVPFHTPGLLEAVRAAQAHGATLDEGLAAQLAEATPPDRNGR